MYLIELKAKLCKGTCYVIKAHCKGVTHQMRGLIFAVSPLSFNTALVLDCPSRHRSFLLKYRSFRFVTLHLSSYLHGEKVKSQVSEGNRPLIHSSYQGR